MANIIVVGAGISGLASAWFLREHGHQVMVLEAADQVGGCMHTVRDDGYLVDAGPTSTLSKNGALSALVHGLDLEEELIEANRAAARRYIVKDNRLIALPSGPLAFARTPLFSTRAKLRLMLEPFHRRARHEESVAQFVRRRLGPEFLDWAIDPFVSGVYAGDPERLSVRAATARIYALEADYGSLFVGAAVRLLRGRASGPQPAGHVVSFRSGMQTLPRALARAMAEQLHLEHEVHELLPRQDGGWLVRSGSEELLCDHLVLAIPAERAAALLAPLDRSLADALRGIAYAPVASIALGFTRASVLHPLDGFGMLIPRRAGRETLGALFSSTLFPNRAPDGNVLLTAFIGGARNPGVIRKDPAELQARVLTDLRPLLGIRDDPVFARVTRWPRAIPQYELGHLHHLRAIDAYAGRFPRLHFRANWRDGISVADCVLNAQRLAEHLR